MKLLPPKELNTKIQDQKKAEIDAGLFLAKKVDKLREDVQEAQRTYDEKIELLKTELADYEIEHARQKEKLEKEISDLIEERRLLRIPLDSEWEKVKKLDKENSELSLKLSERESSINHDEKRNSEKSLEFERREAKIRISESQTAGFLADAKEFKRKAEEYLKRTRTVKENSERDAEIKNHALKKRENDIAYREIDVENKWQNTLIKQEKNEKEIKRIESKQRQLSIAFAELEKRNG